MKLGILGTGDVAQTLAAAWSNAGHEIVFGSRDPGAKSLDFPVRGLAEAVAESDAVVNATRGAASVDTLAAIGPDLFAGKTVIDVTNAFGPGFSLLYPNSSAGEKLQEALPAARVVKTMNTARITMFTDPAQLGPATVFLSGNDPAAKSEAAALLRDFGWSDDAIIDLGGIESARGPEHYFVLFGQLAGALGSMQFNLRVVGATERSTP